jgi:PAS domain S-box-containing protein
VIAPFAEELGRLAQALGMARDLVSVFRALRGYAETVTGCNALFVSLLDAERQTRRCVYAWSDGEEEEVSGLPELPMTGGPHARAVATGEVVVVEDLQTLLATMPNVPLGYDRDPRASRVSIALPLAVFGRIIGGFEVQLIEHTDPWSCVAALRVAASLSAAGIENVRLLQVERSSRREAEASEARYRLSEERLRLALDAAGLGTWQYDFHSHFLGWSPGTEHMFGRPDGDRPNSWSGLLDLVHADDRSLVDRSLGPGIQTAATREVEFRVLTPDGTTRWLAGRAHTTVDASGAALHTSAVVLDITTRKEAEHQREAMARSEQLRVVGQMASGIAHDLNQSLTLISGYAELARQELSARPPDVDHLGETCGIIMRAAQDGAGTLRQLLAFARAQGPESLELVDLGALLREVADLTAPRWHGGDDTGRAIRLELNLIPDDNLMIDGAPAPLREAFTNLIFNAVDALPEGGTLRLSASRRGDLVVAEVSDTGSGIPIQVQARIFEPFFTTKGEHGTGLGLAQVATLVGRLGGQIGVESKPGAGTTFRLLFPAADRLSAVTAPVLELAQLASRPRRVLAVDDEAALGTMIARMLVTEGHQVTVVSSAEEALVLLEAGGFELLISDISLGAGMTGWDLVAEVRERWPAVPIIVASGWGAQIAPEEATARGVAAVLAKPYRMAELRQVVASIGAEQALRNYRAPGAAGRWPAS